MIRSLLLITFLTITAGTSFAQTINSTNKFNFRLQTPGQGLKAYITPPSILSKTLFQLKSTEDNKNPNPKLVKTKRKFGAKFAVLTAVNIALTACDLATTFSMVGNGFEEKNPFIAALLRNVGKPGTGAIIGGLTGLNIYVSAKQYQDGKKYWWVPQLISIAAHGAGCAINLSQR